MSAVSGFISPKSNKQETINWPLFPPAELYFEEIWLINIKDLSSLVPKSFIFCLSKHGNTINISLEQSLLSIFWATAHDLIIHIIVKYGYC